MSMRNGRRRIIERMKERSSDECIIFFFLFFFFFPLEKELREKKEKKGKKKIEKGYVEGLNKNTWLCMYLKDGRVAEKLKYIERGGRLVET